jgi:hypothetical protein
MTFDLKVDGKKLTGTVTGGGGGGGHESRPRRHSARSRTN